MRCEINTNQIKYNTGKAMLITIPKTNSKFWMPVSLVYIHEHAATVYLPEDMIFNCIRGKCTKYEVTAEELAERLGYISKQEIVPTPKVPIKRKIPEELKR